MTDKTKDAEPISDDTLPPVDDDRDIEASAPGDTDVDPSEPPARRTVRTEADEDPRARAVQRYREIREQHAAEVAERAAQAEAEAHEAEAIEETPAGRVRLKVNGREIEKPLNEVIADAQKFAAAEDRLEEAKRLVAEAKALRDASRRQEPEDYPQERPEDPRQAKLREIAERLQVGDVDEAAEALAALNDPSEIDRRVEAKIRQARIDEENRAALQRFAKQFPDLVANKYLAKAGEEVLAEQLTQDFRKLGIPDEAIAPLRSNHAMLVRAHNELRAAGRPLRSADQILAETGKVLSREFGVRGRGVDREQIEARVERKRSMGTQPRAAGVRAPMASAPVQKSARDVVAMIRKSRGFPSIR